MADQALPQIDWRLLQESAEELYEHGPCGYLSMLPDGTMIKLNHTLSKWLGCGRDDLVGSRFQDLLTLPGKIYYETHYAPLLQMQGFANELAFDLVCNNQKILPALLSSHLKNDENGEPLLIRTVIFNATDRRKYENELLRARREAERAKTVKGNLLAMVSHDMRTPAAIISNALSILELTGVSDRQRYAFDMMKSATASLQDLLDEVLEYSRLESNSLVLREAPFTIRGMLEEQIRALMPRAEAKGLLLTLSIDARIPDTIIGDEMKIRHILSNLLTNAIKFTASGEVGLQVEVMEAERESLTVKFSVHDTGIGIPQDKLEEIFQEFTQVSDEIGRQYGGTGLGLAICQRLLELHGSKMHVSSQEGIGSVFSFVLALRLAEPRIKVVAGPR